MNRSWEKDERIEMKGADGGKNAGCQNFDKTLAGSKAEVRSGYLRAYVRKGTAIVKSKFLAWLATVSSASMCGQTNKLKKTTTSKQTDRPTDKSREREPTDKRIQSRQGKENNLSFRGNPNYI